MDKLIIALLLMISSTSLSSQDVEKMTERRPVYSYNVGVLGDISLISIHGERHFYLNPGFMLSGKLGFGYNQEIDYLWGPNNLNEKYTTLTHHITGNYGKGKHFFEFGLGGTYLIGKTARPYNIYPILGFRISPLRTGEYNFRIFILIPILDSDGYIFSPLGISLGMSF